MDLELEPTFSNILLSPCQGEGESCDPPIPLLVDVVARQKIGEVMKGMEEIKTLLGGMISSKNKEKEL